MTTQNTNQNRTASDNQQNQETETMTTTDNTTDNYFDNDNNNDEETMNITLNDLMQIRQLVRDVDSIAKAGIGEKYDKDFRRVLGALHFFTVAWDTDKHGKLLEVTNVRTDKSGTQAWINTKVLSHPFSVRQNDEGELQPSLFGTPITRSKKEVDVNRLKGQSWSALNLYRQAVRNVMPKFEDDALALDFISRVGELDEQCEWLAGANVLLYSKDEDAVVMQLGARRWTYPAIIDMVDPHTLHLYTGNFTYKNGKRVNVPGPLMAEVLGLDAPEETTQEEMTDADFHSEFSDIFDTDEQ